MFSDPILRCPNYMKLVFLNYLGDCHCSQIHYRSFFSSRNKLQLMILSPPEHTAEKWVFLQKNAFSCRKMHWPTEKCTFLQKNAVCGRHMAGNCRKLQEGFFSDHLAFGSEKLQKSPLLEQVAGVPQEGRVV